MQQHDVTHTPVHPETRGIAAKVLFPRQTKAGCVLNEQLSFLKNSHERLFFPPPSCKKSQCLISNKI